MDCALLAAIAGEAGADAGLTARIEHANTAAEALALAERARLPLALFVAEKARRTARTVLGDAPVAVNVFIVDREGRPLAETGHG